MGIEQFNPDILSKLTEYEIEDIDTALLYLLSTYYGLSDKSIPEDIQKRVNLTKIVVRDYSKNIRASVNPPVVWNIPLFTQVIEESDKNWNWVDRVYRKMFEEVRSDAKGDSKATITKMKKFFAENPHVRISDVIKSAEIYLRDFKSGRIGLQYLQRADYFISKRVGGVTESRLSNYIETLIKEQQRELAGGEGRFMNQMKTGGK